jgi:hypothetical protein
VYEQGRIGILLSTTAVQVTELEAAAPTGFDLGIRHSF